MSDSFGEILLWVGVALAIPVAAFFLVLIVNLVRKLSFREAWSVSWDSAMNVLRWVGHCFDWIVWW